MDTPTKALRVGFLFAAVVTGLLGSCSAPKHVESATVPLATPAEADALMDMGPDGGTGRLRIPTKPYDWQKRPPCPKEMGEREINGACYFRMHPDDMRPPCLAPAIEHDGQCYRTIAKAKKEPTSITR